VGIDKDGTILVAGAGGFIGGHLVGALLEDGFSAVRAVDIKPIDRWNQVWPGADCAQADLGDREQAFAAAKGCATIVNLAADMGGMGFIEQNRSLCMLSVLINTHLLLAARMSGVDRYFYASSACVYPAGRQDRADAAALREDDVYPAMPEDGYGWEKLFSERMCRHFREDFGLATRVARYHNVYGPHGAWRGGREKAPAAICRKVAQAAISGDRSIEIWGDGSQTRSFTYIDDCLIGTYLVLNGDDPWPVNVGSSELVSIDALVDVVEEIAGTSLKREYLLDAPKGVRGRNSDNTRIRELFGWEPSTRLRDGMAATYGWVYDQVSRELVAG
jgi:nucleoside-diphosphate-sugar epimerase